MLKDSQKASPSATLTNYKERSERKKNNRLAKRMFEVLTKDEFIYFSFSLAQEGINEL